MTYRIPGNALVILFGGSASGKSTFTQKYFQPSEVVSSDKCRYYVCDDVEEQRHNKEAFSLFHHWIDIRMSLGKLTVADATNLTYSARAVLREGAKAHNVPTVLIKFPPNVERMKNWNRARRMVSSRFVPEHVIEKHVAQYREQEPLLTKEGYSQIITYDYADPSFELVVGFGGKVIEAPGFDIIGDVHGCLHQLIELTDLLGYEPVAVNGEIQILHPEGRKLVFVGDFTDRGPFSVSVLSHAQVLVRQGNAFAVQGNHDNKLARYLKGNKVKISHGLDTTIQQLDDCNGPTLEGFRTFLESLPYQLVLAVPGAPQLVVSHAGIPYNLVGRDTESAQKLSLYGPVSGFEADGLPIRNFEWENTWQGKPHYIVTGHTPYKEPYHNGNVFCVDTGCVFGNKLTALRWPEREFVSVPAVEAYAESKRWVDDGSHRV